MSMLKCALAFLLSVSPILAQKLTGRIGNPAARTFVIYAEIKDEGSFELQRASTISSSWLSITNFNSFPGTNVYSYARTNNHHFYRLVQLNIPPVITNQPTGTTNLVNQEVRLEAAATGSWPLRYQWLKDGQPVAGATSNKLIFVGKENLSGNYNLLVSNSWGLALSSAAAVKSVNPVATNIAGKKIRYVIKGAVGSYISSGNFEATYNAQGFYNATGSSVFLNDAGNWQYGLFSGQNIGRIIYSSFIYANGAAIDLTFTNVNTGTFTLQEFERGGGQFGDFSFIE
jgi:hypothetical protein